MKKDLISRQAAIDKAYLLDLSDTGNSIEIRVIDASDIEQLPSAQPEQKTGRWLVNSDGYYPYCSLCKNEPQGRIMTDYCPNCGAKMEGE